MCPKATFHNDNHTFLIEAFFLFLFSNSVARKSNLANMLSSAEVSIDQRKLLLNIDFNFSLFLAYFWTLIFILISSFL